MCPAPVSRSFSGPWVPWSLGPRLPKFADYFRPPAHTDSMIDARTQIRSLAHSLPYPLGPGACPQRTRRISMSRFNLSGIPPVHDSRITTHDLRLAIHGLRSTAPRFTSSLLHFFTPSLLGALHVHCSRPLSRPTFHEPRFTIHDSPIFYSLFPTPYSLLLTHPHAEQTHPPTLSWDPPPHAVL